MGAIENRKLVWILAGLLLVVAAAFGYTLTRGSDEKKEEVRGDELADKGESPDQSACASNATYARLKEVAFEEALRLPNANSENLDTLAAHSVVRMENPVVKSRDEDLNVTVCSGRFILELPPGSEGAFGGQRRLTADVEYAAQAAADRSGLVYQLRGAEPIIDKLAAFQLRGRPLQMPRAAAEETDFAEVAPAPEPPVAETPAPPSAAPPRSAPPEPRRSEPAPRPAPKQRTAERPDQPVVAPAPNRVEAEPLRRAGTSSNPSFSCRSARTSGERAVCASQSLAARDRAMSSLFYSAMASANGPRRAELRRTRDRFLRYRDRCGSDACIAEAYEGRIREIRDIMEAE